MECRRIYARTERKELAVQTRGLHVLEKRTTLNKPKPWKHIITRSLCETSSKLFNWIHRLFRSDAWHTHKHSLARSFSIHYYCVSFILFSLIPFGFIFCLWCCCCCCCCVVAFNSFISVHIWLRDYDFGECFMARTIFSFIFVSFCSVLLSFAFLVFFRINSKCHNKQMENRIEVKQHTDNNA